MITAAFAASWLAVVATLVAWHLDNCRHAAQLRDVLDRISTEPRIELRPSAPVAATPPVRSYIADHMADDEAWNDYRGEPVDEFDG